MKEIDPGHFYILDKLDDDGIAMDVELFFVKRIGDKFPGNQPPASPGTTTQEVMRALIARAFYVDRQDPHPANAFVIRELRQCITMLEWRAAQRHGRDLFRVQPPLREDIENEPTCDRCGHIRCEEHR